MLNWYRHLYIGKGMRKYWRRAVRDLNAGRTVFGRYLITYAHNPQDQLEIINTANLLQKTVSRRLPEIVGIAADYKDALALVTDLAEETRKETGGADIRLYLESRK